MPEKQNASKRRSSRYEQMPERVENAAQAMQNTSTGVMRGYRPSMQAAGQPGYSQSNGQRMPGQGVPGNPQMNYTQSPIQSGQSRVEPTGAYRGFVMPNPPEPGLVPTCAEGGSISPLGGIVGAIAGYTLNKKA